MPIGLADSAIATVKDGSAYVMVSVYGVGRGGGCLVGDAGLEVSADGGANAPGTCCGSVIKRWLVSMFEEAIAVACASVYKVCRRWTHRTGNSD